jgi:Cu+-exporting ATPase
VALESQEATVVYLPYLITVQTIIDQVAVAGFKAVARSKPRPLKLSPSELERLVDAQRPTEPPEPSEEAEVFVDLVAVALRVGGMHCRSCVVNIEGSVGGLPGVSSVAVCLETGKASVCYDPLSVTVPRLRQAIEALPPGTFTTQLWGAGGPLSPPAASRSPALSRTVEVRIEGMTCGSCVRSIEGTLSQRSGVRSARVSLAEHRGTFEYDPLLTGPEDLREAALSAV